MKQPVWIIVVLAIMTTGCASSEKIPFYSQVVSIIDPNRAHKVPEEPKDDNFELLEDELEGQIVRVPDPLEPVNRVMFQVNDVLYFWVLKPVVYTYKGIVPGSVRFGVSNFFNNVTTPIRFANCMLQGKGDSACIELRRFMVNTTIGVLGFGDPALDKYGLEPAEEDLGQTLGVWGLGNCFYLVLPILGPSTLRDTVGLVGDQFANPIRYVEPEELSMGLTAGKYTNKATFHTGEYESIKADALDPYVAIRNIYIQYRDSKIKE